MPQRILAVEIAGDRLRAATANRTWNSFEFIGVFETHRAADEADLGPALTRLIEKTGHPDVVISALPSDSVAKRLLELPFGDARRLHQVVPFALEEHLPFPVDGAIVAFTRVGRSGENSLVLAAFARKQDVDHHLQLLARAGLDPKILTLAPFAIAAMFARSQNGSEPTAHLVVDADQYATSFVLLDKQGIPRAMRTVAAGLFGPDGLARVAGEMTPVINAMRQTMLAHAAELDHADLVMTGRGATVPKLKSTLSDALSIEAADFDVTKLFEGAQPDLVRFATPIAMLLGELPVKPVEMLNFRKDEFAFRGRTGGDLTPFYTTAALAACLLGFVILHFILGFAGKVHELRALNREIARIAGPVLGESDPPDPINELRSGIAAMNKHLRLLGGNLSRNSALDTLMAVSKSIPSRFPAEIEDLQVDPTGLRITGLADSFATVDQVKRALEQSGEFESIEVTHANSGNESDKVEFRLSADFKDTEGKTD
ncbi:MAG: pilus assembly protein PilM [Candidatus Binataceae bacterium]